MKQEVDDEPNVWVTTIKLILGALALIALVGGALWLAAQEPVHSPAEEQAQTQAEETARSTGTKLPGSSGWGIAKDSPLRPPQ